jgi:molybdate-binding protein/DNA-binding XRE family transcriptional regulator
MVRSWHVIADCIESARDDTSAAGVDRIMAIEPALDNRVREMRQALGWSQDELARRSGLSRTGVSAIEMRRLVPSTASALALASALECRVEDLFSLSVTGSQQESDAWAWPAPKTPWRYWRAEVWGRTRLYPVEASPLGFLAHDGVFGGDLLPSGAPSGLPSRTLVMASCDPAVGLLGAELAREAGIRLLVFQRSSRQAIELLGRGVVHVAGVHLAGAEAGESNVEVARDLLGPERRYELLRVADWEEGIALAPSTKIKTVRAAVEGRLRWIGREEGSGARRCLDEILGAFGRKDPPRMLPPAGNHRGVAEAIRRGWADAGVCLRLTSEEADLHFLNVRYEAYELCFPAESADDPRLRALIQIIRSASFRRILGELPGYSSSRSGEIQNV